MSQQTKSQPLKYNDYKIWLQKIYLTGIKELYENYEYTSIIRFRHNYLTIIENLKRQDPLYRNKPGVQVRSERRLLAEPRWQKIGRRLINGWYTEEARRLRELISKENDPEQAAVIKRAENWFDTAASIPEEHKPNDDRSVRKPSLEKPT